MRRSKRKTVAWLCLSALLSLQFAVAAYACPTRTQDDLVSGSSAASAASPCEGMKQERSKLCEQHCVHASQSVDTQPHSSVTVPVLPLIAVVAAVEPCRPRRARYIEARLVTAVDPPPLIRFGVLRI
jgi:hypothetical protein